MTPHYCIKKNSRIYNKYLGGLIFALTNVDTSAYVAINDTTGTMCCLIKFNSREFKDCFEPIPDTQPKEFTKDDMINFLNFMVAKECGISFKEGYNELDIWLKTQNK